MDISSTKYFGNIYNLGGAHGISTLSEDRFKEELLKLVSESNKSNFVAITNSSQNEAHRRLVSMGFTETKSADLIVHTATKDALLSPKVLKSIEKAKEERKAALAARPRNKDGRLLRSDGTLIRRPYEYFVGDRVKFRSNGWFGDWKEGAVREVIGTGIRTQLKLRTKTINVNDYPADCLELVERAQ